MLGLSFVGVGGWNVGGWNRTRCCKRRGECLVRPQAVVKSEFEDFKDLERALRDYIEKGEYDLGEGEVVGSPIAYNVLAKAGRFDLLEGVMEYGGYIQISEKLGLEFSIPEKVVANPNDRVLFKRTSPNDGGGFLTLGGAKADRLSEEGVSEAFVIAKKKQEEREQMKEILEARRNSRESKRQFAFMKRFADIAAKKEKKTPIGESLQLNFLERGELIFEFFVLSAAFGRLGQGKYQ